MNTSWPRLLFITGICSIILVSGLTLSSVFATNDPASASVQLDRDIHFLSPGGEDVVVPSGEYEIEAAETWIRIIPSGGARTDAILVKATSMTHEETMDAPTALSFSEAEDEHFLVLLTPDGQGLEALGSYSGVRSRALKRPRTSRQAVRRQFQVRRSPRLLAAHFTLTSVASSYPSISKNYQATKTKTGWNLPVSDSLNVGRFTFVWKRTSKPGPNVSSILRNNSKNCCVKLMVDGKEIRGKLSPSQSRFKQPPFQKRFGKQPTFQVSVDRAGNLVTTARLSKARSANWPKTVKLVVTYGRQQFVSSNNTVRGSAVSYYATVLHSVFSGPRCTTCHSLVNQAAIVAMHDERLGQGAYPNVPAAVPHNPSFCGNCHNAPELNNEWFSPHEVQGIDWAGKNAMQVCSIVTGPFTDGEGTVGPPVDLHHHFHVDPRIVWAASNGWVPFSRPPLPVPFSTEQQWFNTVDPWVAAGAPCPKFQLFQGIQQRKSSSQRFRRR